MTAFTISELKDIMLKTMDGTAPTLDGEFLDTSFRDLDFDSLTVLEIATRIQQEYHLAIPDESVALMITPRDVLNYVTQRLHESAHDDALQSHTRTRCAPAQTLGHECRNCSSSGS